MNTVMILIFLIGYLAIALEHPLRIDKAASALVTAVLCWAILSVPNWGAHMASHGINEELMHHLGEISGILFFLLGAMTIVEIVDAHSGFEIITRRITTKNKGTLLVALSFITFFMSAALDNLTTAIIMATLLRKLLSNKKDLWLFAGVIIIAANAGGAWSPIGDVTTIMLWIVLGILLAVAALQTGGILTQLATFLNESIGNIWVINIIIGVLSSVVDNVPLVAGAIGMYDLSMYPPDHVFWELLALCAGTGGSCLIIGSAAGVAIMGILKIDFIWYLKNISLLALSGYLSSVLVFYLMNVIL